MDAGIIIGLAIMVAIFWYGWKKTHSKKSSTPSNPSTGSGGSNGGGIDVPEWPEEPKKVVPPIKKPDIKDVL